MIANVQIGDTNLTIRPAYRNNAKDHADKPVDEHHVCCSDSFTNKAQTVYVDNEGKAVEVLQGFLNMDGPIGLFAELFPEE